MLTKQGGDPLAIYVCQIRLHTLNFYNVIYQSYFNKMGKKITQFRVSTLRNLPEAKQIVHVQEGTGCQVKIGVTLANGTGKPMPLSSLLLRIKLQCIWKQFARRKEFVSEHRKVK